MAAGHGGQVLVSASTAALAGDELPDGSALRDLGEHRLKDLDRAERLFQVAPPGPPGELPAARRPSTRRPTNLPSQPSAFVGREAELDAIRQRLGDDGVRLLTLTGPGGIGKTRLALRAAADQVDRFADGVYFVDLSAARDADAVVALDRRRDRPGGRARAVADRRARGAPAAARSVLLVLDNFEQVIGRRRRRSSELLEQCPGLTLLVTSREALRVRGEHLLTGPAAGPPRAGAASASCGRARPVRGRPAVRGAGARRPARTSS